MTDVFLNFVGNSPTARVMGYVIECRELDFCFTDIADNAKVSRPTLYKIWDDLLEQEMVIYTRTIGKSKLYKANMKNSNVKRLAEIYDSLMEREMTKLSRKVKLKLKPKTV